MSVIIAFSYTVTRWERRAGNEAKGKSMMSYYRVREREKADAQLVRLLESLVVLVGVAESLFQQI